MEFKKILLFYGLSLLSSTIFAANASIAEYDNVPITPQTWQEVNLIYDNYIGGKKYTEIAKLLRPISWLKQRNLDTKHLNKSVHLTKDDIDVDVNVTIIAIKPTSIYFDNESAAKNIKRPVIGVFIRHANNITDYTFKNKSGHLETIQATTEHPFYSIDRHDYVPIGQIWQDSSKYDGKEQLQTETGEPLILVNAKAHNTQVEVVYNFEVYKAHNYLVGNGQLLVHNNCGSGGDGIEDLYNFEREYNNAYYSHYSTSTSIDMTELEASGELNAASDRVRDFVGEQPWYRQRHYTTAIVDRSRSWFANSAVQIRGYANVGELNLNGWFNSTRGASGYAEFFEVTATGLFTGQRLLNGSAVGIGIYPNLGTLGFRGISARIYGADIGGSLGSVTGRLVNINVGGLSADATIAGGSGNLLNISANLASYSLTDALPSLSRAQFGGNIIDIRANWFHHPLNLNGIRVCGVMVCPFPF
jgi:hypothetical protein